MREWQIRHARVPNPGACHVSSTSPVHLTLCARRAPAPLVRAPTRLVTREIQSHTHSLRPATWAPTSLGEVLSLPDVGELYTTIRRSGLSSLGYTGGSQGQLSHIVERADGDKSKGCKYVEGSY